MSRHSIGYRAFIVCLLLVCSQGCRRHESIRILGEDVSTTRALQTIADDYNKATDGRVSLEFHLGNYDQLIAKSTQDLANQTGVYDIVIQYNTALAPYVENAYVYSYQDLRQQHASTNPTLFGSSFESDVFSSTWHESGWYYRSGPSGPQEFPVGIPFSANSILLCYNRSLFSDPDAITRYSKRFGTALRLPTTWDEFYNVASFFTDPERKTHGLCLCGTDYFIYYEWANVYFSHGAEVMKGKRRGWEPDRDMQLTLTTPRSVEATRFYLSLKPFDGSTDFFTTDVEAQRLRMKRGDIAMCFAWSDAAYAMATRSDGSLDSTLAFAPMPGQTSLLAGGSFFINKRTKHKQAALDFIEYVLRRDTQALLAQRGLCPPRRDAYDNPAVSRIPFMNALRVSLDRGVYMIEGGPDADAIITVLSSELQKLWRTGDPNDVPKYLGDAERDIGTRRAEIYKQLAARARTQ